MAKGRFNNDFYMAPQWKKTRRAYAEYRHHLCEKCLERGKYSPGDVVHHKIYLTPQNINIPEIAYGFDNLILLCHDCHNKQHKQQGAVRDGLMFNDKGELIKI